MELSDNERTIEFYDRNAAKYFEETAYLNVEGLRSKFIELLPCGARILDAGCGSGRDTRAFREMGFDVVAIDASKGIAKQAKEQFGIGVEILRIEEIPFDSEFDGVWASASLLHLSGSLLLNGLERLSEALRIGGVLYSSFKQGESGEWRNGRFFQDMSEANLRELIRGTDSLRLLEIWDSQGLATEHSSPVLWKNFLAKKVKP